MRQLLIIITLCFFQFQPAFAEQNAGAGQPEPTLDQMLGSMLMFGFRGHMPDANFLDFVSSGKITNFILFERDVTLSSERNIASPDQVRQLTAALRKASPAQTFIGVDQEGGQVRRLKPQKGFMDLPAAQRMGQSNAHETYAIADQLGREMAGLGINLDLAPVVDVDTNPFNPLVGKLGRAFNSDAKLVAQHALAFGRGLAKNGVVPTLKHFPGQGCANNDTHLEPADISQCWNPDVDLLPYAEIFKAGWPGMVMVGHLTLKGLDNSLPATLSRNIVTGLLRDGLGWNGVVISDDLQMKAVSQGRDLKETMALAIEAGVDILMFGNNLEWDESLPAKVWETLNTLVAEGRISQDRIRASWSRIKTLHEAYSSENAAAQ